MADQTPEQMTRLRKTARALERISQKIYDLRDEQSALYRDGWSRLDMTASQISALGKWFSDEAES